MAALGKLSGCLGVDMRRNSHPSLSGPTAATPSLLSVFLKAAVRQEDAGLRVYWAHCDLVDRVDTDVEKGADYAAVGFLCRLRPEVSRFLGAHERGWHSQPFNRGDSRDAAARLPPHTTREALFTKSPTG